MVRFDPEYPFKSPAVQFVVSDKVKPPVHPVRSSWVLAHSHQTHGEPHPSTSTRTATYASSQFDIAYAPASNLSQICASILGDDWSPTLSVMAICITIQSMLASCKVRIISKNAVSLRRFSLVPTEERIVSQVQRSDPSCKSDLLQARR